MIFWWKSSIIIIVSTTKIAIITHDQIMKKCNYLTIFTNNIDIDNQIEAFAMTIIFLMSNMTFIMMNKKQVYLKFITKITIYFEKIIRLDLVLNVTENHFRNHLQNRILAADDESELSSLSLSWGKRENVCQSTAIKRSINDIISDYFEINQKFDNLKVFMKFKIINNIIKSFYVYNNFTFI
jgi:hypothetical protein